ncbi:MAG: 6-carboxytetrahydropterin synthase [Bacteriovoracaceae bacterium]
MAIYYSTKSFKGFPCTHRQWKAEGHCRFVHGYSREFNFTFACKEFSKEMWVVDFGGLKEIKAWLDEMFDHTFLSSEDDPYLDEFRRLDELGVLKLKVLPNCGMEGTAKYVYDVVNPKIATMSEGRAWIHKLEVRENEKNSAIYIPETPTPGDL